MAKRGGKKHNKRNKGKDNRGPQDGDAIRVPRLNRGTRSDREPEAGREPLLAPEYIDHADNPIPGITELTERDSANITKIAAGLIAQTPFGRCGMSLLDDARAKARKVNIARVLAATAEELVVQAEAIVASGMEIGAHWTSSDPRDSGDVGTRDGMIWASAPDTVTVDLETPLGENSAIHAIPKDYLEEDAGESGTTTVTLDVRSVYLRYHEQLSALCAPYGVTVALRSEIDDEILTGLYATALTDPEADQGAYLDQMDDIMIGWHAGIEPEDALRGADPAFLNGIPEADTATDPHGGAGAAPIDGEHGEQHENLRPQNH